VPGVAWRWRTTASDAIHHHQAINHHHAINLNHASSNKGITNMSPHTNLLKQWTPLHVLGILACWLLVVIAIAVAIFGGCGSTPPATNGSITLTWSILDRNQQPATCAQVNARSVALRLRNRASGAIVATAFPCEASPGTAPVAAAAYDVAIELHTADGSKLAAAPDQLGVTVTAGQITRLAPVTFTASTETTLVLTVATSAATNCQSPPGGAGITGTALTLAHVVGGCAPVTFIRQRGTEQRGTYTVNCSSASVVACLERDETLTATVAPGAYELHVVGKHATLDCWVRDDTFTVPPPSGSLLVHPVGLVHQNIPGC
jgi:hypothetical protein